MFCRISAYASILESASPPTDDNKDIINGIDPVIAASGNDWRAVETGAYAYA